jgi:hypothetical protein
MDLCCRIHWTSEFDVAAIICFIEIVTTGLGVVRYAFSKLIPQEVQITLELRL